MTTDRPLNTRSVLLSTLLGTEPPELPVRSLVRVGQLFDIAEGSVRTSLSRMVARGELEMADGRYRLVARQVGRQRRQLSGRRAESREWSGSWHLAIVERDRRTAADRADLRSEMESSRYGEVREGVWMRPDNLRQPRPMTGTDQCIWGAAEPDDPVGLANTLWDVAELAASASSLVQELEVGIEHLQANSTAPLADLFHLSARVLRHFARDPLLPAELLSDQFSGPRLRTTYDSFDARFRSVLLDWIRES